MKTDEPIPKESAMPVRSLACSADALAKALTGIMRFRSHRRECEIDQTDFCTCGLKEAADAARDALGVYYLPNVTLLIKHRDGRVQEINTDAYASAEECLRTFIDLHKRDILEEGWEIEVKKVNQPPNAH
jgi:hypothetical protein